MVIYVVKQAFSAAEIEACVCSFSSNTCVLDISCTEAQSYDVKTRLSVLRLWQNDDEAENEVYFDLISEMFQNAEVCRAIGTLYFILQSVNHPNMKDTIRRVSSSWKSILEDKVFRSLACSLTCSITCSLTHLLTRSLTCLLVHLLTHSSLTSSLVH